MSSVLGLSCTSPPPLTSILFSTDLFPILPFVKSIVVHPDASMGKYEQFFYSKFFLLVYLWYVVFRIPREMSLMLSTALGINFSILMIVNMLFLFESFRRHGYECTVLLSIVLYLVYIALLASIPLAAKSVIGDAIPELKELPVSTREPGLNHCRRLAVCRATPVYDNYLFQRGKYAKCLECARRNEGIVFDASNTNCTSDKRNIDAKGCYKCTEGQPPPDRETCRFSDADCLFVNTVLDLLDKDEYENVFEDHLVLQDNGNYVSDGTQRLTRKLKDKKYPNRAELCKEAEGTLCWFACEDRACKSFVGWNKDPNAPRFSSIEDADANGHGYPTESICMQENSGTQCRKATKCAYGTDVIPRCACEQYRDVHQYTNPCRLFEGQCDDNSIAYTEAVLKLKQVDVVVEDIISVDDVDRFLETLDTVAKKIP